MNRLVNGETHYKAVKSKMIEKYQKCRMAWDDCGENDYRYKYCRTYDQIMNALETMKGIDNAFIWCGFYNELENGTKRLDFIKGH